MSNVQKVRDQLKALAPGEDMSSADIATATSIKNVMSVVTDMVKSGEVKRRDSSGKLWFRLNPDFVSKRGDSIERTLPVKRKGKKKKVSKKAAEAMLNRKASPRAAAQAKPSLSALVLENLKAAAAHLANTVRGEVEGVEDNPTLSAALEQHARAAALVEAVA